MNGRRVAITGLGVVSAVGIGKRAYFDALLEGKSGIRKIERFETGDLPAKIAGTIVDFDALEWIGDKKRASKY